MSLTSKIFIFLIILVLPLGELHAETLLSKLIVSKEKNILILENSAEGAQFGSSIAVGDFNGDKVD